VALQPLGGLPVSALSKFTVSGDAAARSNVATTDIDVFMRGSNLSQIAERPDEEVAA
jgi:hypothetical protein